MKLFEGMDPLTMQQEWAKTTLGKKFIVSPFSVLNAREGFWQERKRTWLALGIESEVGRDAVTCQIGDKATWEKKRNKTSPGGSPRPACDYHKRERGTGSGHAIKGSEAGRTKQATGRQDNLTWQGAASSFDSIEVKAGSRKTTDSQGTSIFDPVLCELAYSWFCPPGGQIVDPFAGGSVRGIVAHKLGYRYWGCDLRAEQITANGEQAAGITPDNSPEWICGDALEELDESPKADLIFTCPPYGDLEVYCDDPRDLSNMEYHTFLATYKRIILRACKRLKENRFACIVVGDFRDKRTGNYRNFVSDTIAAFLEQGLHLYNEAILVTAVGSLPIRITKQFEASRKLGKTHQNILVFVKGDGKSATKAIREGSKK